MHGLVMGLQKLCKEAISWQPWFLGDSSCSPSTGMLCCNGVEIDTIVNVALPNRLTAGMFECNWPFVMSIAKACS